MAAADLTLLIDASSLIYRAFFALPDTIKAPDGTVVNAAHGFIDMIASLIATERPARLACAFDHDWRPQWRVTLVPAYKAHRVAAEDGEGVVETPAAPEAQEPVIQKVLSAARIAAAGAAGFEAEDVIGTIAKRATGRVGIVSGDRDLFALVRDPDVFVLYPRKGVSDVARIDQAQIEARYGIPGDRYFDFAVLRGDPSDGLPGVRGVGEKSAAALVRAHGSLDDIIRAARTGPKTGPLGKVAAELDYVRKAAQVVRIRTDVPIGRIDTRLHPPDTAALEALGETWRLAGPVRRLAEAMRSVLDG